MTKKNSTRPRWVLAVAASAVLIVGLAVGFVLAGGRSDTGGTVPLVADSPAEPGGPETPPSAEGFPSLQPLDASTSADAVREALTAFLDAEADGDYEASFELLSRADQEQYGVVEQWTQAHADLPPITAAEVTQVGRLDGRIVGRADLELDSTLNEFVGLVPARAVGSWELVQQDEDWRVAYTDSVVQDLYPPDDDAAAAAGSWASAYAESCQRPEESYGGPLYGEAFRLDALCDFQGDVEVDTVARLPEDAQARPFVAAFGPSAYNWARVVPLTAPAGLSLVLAPVADSWTVVGVLPR